MQNETLPQAFTASVGRRDFPQRAPEPYQAHAALNRKQNASRVTRWDYRCEWCKHEDGAVWASRELLFLELQEHRDAGETPRTRWADSSEDGRS